MANSALVDSAIVSPKLHIIVYLILSTNLINFDSSLNQQILSLGHNCVNTLDDTLCKIKADNGNCYTNARIPGSSITYRTYMEERCNQACGYCIGSLIIFQNIPFLNSKNRKFQIRSISLNFITFEAGIKKPSTTCFGESYVADEMLTASMAHEQCKQDPNCAAVVDLKCNNQVARFCPIGYTEKTDSSSCTYPKIGKTRLNQTSR